MSELINIQMAAREWLQQGLSDDQVKAELLRRGIEERHVPEMMSEVKKLRNARKTSQGLILLLTGGIVCLLSCVLTMTTEYSHSSFGFVLYGFTTLGILIAFAGLMKIFN